MGNEKKYSAALAPYSEREDGRRMKMSIGFLAPGATDALSPKEPRKVKESSGQTSCLQGSYGADLGPRSSVTSHVSLATESLNGRRAVSLLSIIGHEKTGA